MRIWTLNPSYLDRQGLLAVWRETLLAQAVLLGKTKGYRNHPQLIRFREQPDPIAAIATYLAGIHDESIARGYHFDLERVHPERTDKIIIETDGQLLYEWAHLKRKLETRTPELFERFRDVPMPEPHPLFKIIKGEIKSWEKL